MVKTASDGQSVNIPTLPVYSNGGTERTRYGALLNLTLLRASCSLGKSGELPSMADQARGKILPKGRGSYRTRSPENLLGLIYRKPYRKPTQVDWYKNTKANG